MAEKDGARILLIPYGGTMTEGRIKNALEEWVRVVDTTSGPRYYWDKIVVTGGAVAPEVKGPVYEPMIREVIRQSEKLPRYVNVYDIAGGSSFDTGSDVSVFFRVIWRTWGMRPKDLKDVGVPTNRFQGRRFRRIFKSKRFSAWHLLEIEDILTDRQVQMENISYYGLCFWPRWLNPFVLMVWLLRKFEAKQWRYS